MSSKAINITSISGSSEIVCNNNNSNNKSQTKLTNVVKSDKKQNEPIFNAANKAITSLMNNIESSFEDLKKKNRKNWSSVSKKETNTHLKHL